MHWYKIILNWLTSFHTIIALFTVSYTWIYISTTGGLNICLLFGTWYYFSTSIWPNSLALNTNTYRLKLVLINLAKKNIDW